jgi:peptidoglycan/xylan/chitin deacetylase (PgdA/CDA1 family)
VRAPAACRIVLAAGLSLALGLVAALPAAAQRPLAITFDDLPATGPSVPGETRLDAAVKIIAALKVAQVPPIWGFVNGVSLTADSTADKVLPAWRAAGFPLGNHTFSHIDLNAMPEAAFEADVLKNEPILAAQMDGQDWRWLRFPYLSQGETPEKQAAARAFLRAHGYRIAAVTMDFDDFAFNEPYARCVAKGDQEAVARLEQAYLQAAANAADYARELSVGALGREIPYVLLMHIGHIDAQVLPRLLAQYRAEGFTFVTLDQAMRDPFYAADYDLAAPPATDNLATAMAQHGKRVPPQKTDLGWLDGVCL